MTAQRCEPQDPSVDGPDIRTLVRHSSLPVWLFRLEDRTITEASDAMLGLLGAGRGQLLGHDATDFIVDRPPARARLALLASGEIDGFRVLRKRIRRLDGREVLIDACVTAFTDEVPCRLALGVILPSADAGLELALPVTSGTADVAVLGTVDSAWRVDRVSADIGTLLGYQAQEVIGRPVASLIYAGDAPSLLIALGEALQGRGGACARLHLRNAAGGWQLCRAFITPLAGQGSDGLGFAFVLTDPASSEDDVRAGKLEGHLRRIAREVAATGVLSELLGVPAAAALPAMAGLSWREIEIVTGLLGGDRVPKIARKLYLSESTVRNHLTSVYRKLGVSSQQELLTKLRPVSLHDPDPSDR